MKEIYRTVQRRDILIYAKRTDLLWPLWSTAGELRWGLQHVLSAYDKYCGNIKTDKPHLPHWESLLAWCDLEQDSQVIPALKVLSQKIIEAERITELTERKTEIIAEKEQEGIARLIFKNKENKLFLILDTLKDTGYIITGWSQNERH